MDFVKDMKKDSQAGNSVEGAADNAANQGKLLPSLVAHPYAQLYANTANRG